MNSIEPINHNWLMIYLRTNNGIQCLISILVDEIRHIAHCGGNPGMAENLLQHNKGYFIISGYITEGMPGNMHGKFIRNSNKFT